MDQISSQQIEGFLCQYGWNFKKVDESHYETGWQGKKRSFPMTISICDTWIGFEITPFLETEIDWESWPEVSAFLLEFNDRSRMVKASTNEQQLICLSIEAFASRFCFAEFSDCLGILGFYADQLDDELHDFLEIIGYCEELENLTL